MTGMTDPFWGLAAHTAVPPAHFNRTLPGADGDDGGTGSTSSLNVVLIVGFALLISVLARYLSGRGRRK